MSDFRLNFIFSIVFHVAVLTLSVTGLPMLGDKGRDLPRPIYVDYVEIDDVTRDKAPPVREKPVVELEPEPQQVAQAPDLPKAAAPSLSEDAVPLPDAKPRKKPDIKKPAAIRTVVTSTAPRQKPSRFNTSRIAALLDKSIQPVEQQKPQYDQDFDKDMKQAQENMRMASMRDQIATATLVDAVRQQASRCWNTGAGAMEAEKLKVSVTVRLGPDGSIIGAPVIGDRGRMSTDPFYRDAAERARRAVLICAPYDLPKDRYEQWKRIQFTFDPSKMLGG